MCGSRRSLLVLVAVLADACEATDPGRRRDAEGGREARGDSRRRRE